MLHKMGPDLLLNPDDLVLLFATVDAHAYIPCILQGTRPSEVPGHIYKGTNTGMTALGLVPFNFDCLTCRWIYCYSYL